ncbi:SCO family protein [Polaribacter glomeratus]|uniref:SCO family protein n=1 Tax=Polaribacter glomeratus TaxID=102 RepID=A0A2S7WZM1_9FLAO|nr:SCO family protein [Polaribacter glomeratus]PQJ82976.1 SCO family protein [Polaribacter glomeratus]TXD66591.1 SCO family protein [Polaribacter glomeratus]
MKSKLCILFFGTTLFFGSCNKASKAIDKTEFQCPMKCEGDKVYAEKGVCPVCKMDLQLKSKPSKTVAIDFISDESIFNLTSKWNTEEGKIITLKELKGKTLVVVMIYTTCKAACPRLAADMRNIEAKIPTDYKNEVNYILVSIDPKTDTPEKLKKFAIENYMDDNQWTFLQGTEIGVREFANVLAVKYKEISPLDFSHSNIISVFDPLGELVHQQEGLGVDNNETIKKIIETVNN